MSTAAPSIPALEIKSPLDPHVTYAQHHSPQAKELDGDLETAPHAEVKEDDADHATGPHTKRFLWWRLPRKHWIAAIVGSVLAVLAILLLILFLAVFPALFQKFADKIELSVNYLDLVQLPTDPAARDIGVELSLRLKHDSSLKSRTEAVESTLYYADAAFGVVTIPPQHLAKGEHEFDILIRDTLRIVDVEVFTQLCQGLVTRSSVVVDARAKVKAHALGLTYGGLALDREFSIRGVDQMRANASNITHMGIAGCDARSFKILTNVSVDNQSQLGLGGMGALNASVRHRQAYLGNALMLDAQRGIVRGPNALQLEITVENRPGPMGVLRKVLSEILMGTLELEITGENPQAVSVPLLKDAVTALNMSLFFHEGLSGITLNPKCDLQSLLLG